MAKLFHAYCVLFLLMIISLHSNAAVAASANATVTASISPSGTLEQVSNVPVTFTYTFRNGFENANLINYNVKFNGADQTELFTNAAQFKNPSPTKVTADIEYLFAPGTYTFSTTVQLEGEPPVVAETTFTVPGDEQIRRKNTALSKISLFMHQWDHYKFGPAISLGNLGTFRDSFYDDSFQIYVDPDFLLDPPSVAAYVEIYLWKYVWTVYDRDLVISTEPEAFSLDSSETLWHEGIHAISHGLQLAGSASKFTYSDDHLYIEWAESCIRGLAWLKYFEQYVNTNGIATPPAESIASNARRRWKKFVTACDSGSTFGRSPTAAEKAELTTVMGFDIDPVKIKNSYITEHNYPPEYFDDVSVRITSPSTGTEVDENQVDVTASVTIGDPSIIPAQVGFIVNGSTQLSSLSGNSFSATAVLATGNNTIVAGMLSTSGRTYLSTPITVVSNALNNRYHIQINWDKDDTDVDLHFSWSGGSKCYFSNKTPDWGGAAVSPRLDVDDRNGYGPENITIDALPGPGAYSIFVHYWSDHGNGGTNVTATIFENGISIFSSSHYMTNGENWTLLDFSL